MVIFHSYVSLPEGMSPMFACQPTVFCLVGQVWGVALLALLSAIFFGLLIGAKRVQTRRRLQWLQKQRNTGHRYVGLETQELTGGMFLSMWDIFVFIIESYMFRITQ